MKKRILIRILCIGMCFIWIQPTYADDLELNTEDATRDNEDSLTDTNNIPIFTDEYQENKKDVFVKEDIFITEIEDIDTDQKGKQELFQQPVVVQPKKIEEVTSDNVLLIIAILVLIISFCATIVGTKIYQKKKYSRRGSHDSNIYEGYIKN